MPNVLVTGGTGQIGVYVCEELLRRGNNVVIYDYKPNMNDIAHIQDKVKVFVGDVLDLEELLHVMKTSKITHVIHLAAMLVLESKERPAKSIRVNCVGGNNIFEASRLLDIERTLFTSSVVVYGLSKFYPSMKVSEDDFPHCPPEPYSIGKFVNESMGQFYKDTYGLDLLCLRLTGAWGPGRYWGYTGRFNDFIRNVALGKRSTVHEDFAYRGAKMRWLYVKEMAAAIAFAIFVEKNKTRTGVYNTGSSSPFKTQDVVDLLKELLPDSKIDFQESDAPTNTSSTIAGPSGLDVDCSRLYNELGFIEILGLRGALKDMINSERSKANLNSIS
jgi:nucleoside-diphosphate-sugar epimerase